MQEIQLTGQNIRAEDRSCKDEQQEDGGEGKEAIEMPARSSLISILVPDGATDPREDASSKHRRISSGLYIQG